ncbi:MAG: histidinol-phosphate transaminase [Lawsonibacter sp.]|jgi:histidinol-phosphate aminotransferase|nr:histidinol-phosphate transaminase [Lawsonibacter sp.]
MSRYMSARFDGLEAYVPGEQPQDMRYVKLNTNESPFPPSPEVRAAVNAAEAERLNRYPDPEGKVLRARLAEMYGVEPDNVFLANGSDELLFFAFLAFCDGERPVAFPSISYGFYPVYAQLLRLPYTEVPLREGFVLDPADYCGLGKNIVIANPNAPTGRAISTADIEEIVRSNPDHVVLIDEAYVDFGGESCLPLIHKYDNLLVCQTFSKFRSLAGGRLGFALAGGGLIAGLEKIRYSINSYNINRLTAAAALATLDSNGYYLENSKKIQASRAYAAAELDKLGFETLPSLANFIFTRCPRMEGGALYQALKAKGVLVRHWDRPEISDWLRVTIGTREQMDIFLDKVREILKEAG